jgi:hypothetical protein
MPLSDIHFSPKQGKYNTKTLSPIERHAASVYTRGAFDKFVEQFSASLSFRVEATSTENELRVVYNGDGTKKCWGRDVYNVHANIADGEFSCICKLFEHMGILCSHILMVRRVQIRLMSVSMKFFTYWLIYISDWSTTKMQVLYTMDSEKSLGSMY